MLIYKSQFLCYKCYDSLLFFFFFFFFEKYTKRQELFCYFLMKTLLTLKYPVFIIVTNSNSKVHPFTERTDGKPLVQESCENVTRGLVKKPACCSISAFVHLGVSGKSVSCFVVPLKHLHEPKVTHRSAARGHLGSTVLEPHGSEQQSKAQAALTTLSSTRTVPLASQLRTPGYGRGTSHSTV